MPNDRESRRIAQEQVVTALARHTSYLHRASTAQVNAITKAIESLSLNMTRELGERLDNLTPAELSAFSRGRYTTDRLKGLRNVIDGWAVKMGETLNGMALGGFEELAGHEAEFARTLLSESIEGALPAAPTAAAAYASAVAKPVLGELVEDMLAEIPDKARKLVYSRVRQGISQGETNHQIVRALRGTKGLNYKDGVLQTTRNDIERVVRTARNHVSTSSYNDTYEALGVEEVVDVATLDGRVSKYCASIDGRRHKVGTNHPRPPYHPFCRTTQAPSFDGQIMGRRPFVRALKVKGREDTARFRSIGEMTQKQRKEAGLTVGQVSAKTTYPKWFADQPASYQKEWLGPSRYKLYKDGGYTIERFVDPIKGELTLDQLRQRDAATFAELFG
ncbi:minor capsid protein [Halomonas sp. 86]|uniref:minor capsid protein n=1 Tax=unclassified Halomonas TaxID=2609666 RepID=UPI004033A550